MVNEIEPFDPTKIASALKDKIRLEVIGLIPEATWKGMIEQEIKSFFKDEGRNIYGHRVPAGFKGVVLECLNEEVKRRMKEVLAGKDWDTWSPEAIGVEIKAAAGAMAPEILATFARAMIADVVQSMKNRL